MTRIINITMETKHFSFLFIDLIAQIKEDNLQAIKENIENYESVLNDTTLDGRSPLYHAVRDGHIDISKFLLSNGADASIKTDIGRTVYHNAAYNGNIKILEMLVTHSDKYVNEVDNKNFTPLYVAVQQGHEDVVKLLLLNKSDVSVKTEIGRTVYHSAAYCGNLHILQIIISHNNTHVNDVDKRNVTPLYLAVQQRQTKVVQYLLENKADVSIKTNIGRSVYHKAACDGNLEIMNILLNHTCQFINDSDDSDKTPLLIASQCDHLKVVRLLLCKNALPAFACIEKRKEEATRLMKR